MKHTFLLLLLSLGTGLSFAQSSNATRQRSALHNAVVSSLLHRQSGSTAAMKPTAGASFERVIAQSTRDNTLATLIDSVNLKYGINRGSSFDYNSMIYAYNYPYNSSPMFNYAGLFTKPQVLFDTLRRWTVNPNTLVYGYYQTDIAAYDANRNMTDYKALYVDSAFYPNMIYANTFNAANDISIGIASKWKLGAADSAFKQYFTYNTSDQLIKDSVYELHLGVWRIVSRTSYTYDISGNLVQIEQYANMTDTSFLLPLVRQQKYVNTYDGSNRLLTVLDSSDNGASMMQNIKDTFAYTGTYAFHTAWRQHQWDVINSYWAPMFNMTKHLNGSGLPDTVTIQGFDSLLNSWVPQTRNVYHYNGANNPDTLKDYEYNFTSYPSTPNFTTKYYYEIYVNTLENNGVASFANSVKVFPNPSANAITLSGLDVAPNAPVALTLLNMNGQMVSRESLPWHGETVISMNGMAPGIYWLVMQDAAGNILHRQAVVKE